MFLMVKATVKVTVEEVVEREKRESCVLSVYLANGEQNSSTHHCLRLKNNSLIRISKTKFLLFEFKDIEAEREYAIKILMVYILHIKYWQENLESLSRSPSVLSRNYFYQGL